MRASYRVIIVLISIIGLLLFNAFNLQSKQLDQSIPLNDIPVSTAQLVETLSNTIKFPTISREDAPIDESAFAGLHKYLEQRFPLIYSTLRVTRYGNYSVLFEW
jgi:carboxypeptidase PM20D1